MCMERIFYVVCNNDRSKEMIAVLDSEGVSVTLDIDQAIKWDSIEEANTFMLLLYSYLSYDLEDRIFVVKACKLLNIK